MKFKEGDKVRVIKVRDALNTMGHELLFLSGTIMTVDKKDTDLPYFVKLPISCRDHRCDSWWFGDDELTGKVGRPTKPKPTKFIVIWDENADPAKEFADKKEMMKFIKELGSKPAVKKESVKWFEVKSSHQITYGVSIRSKKI